MPVYKLQEAETFGVMPVDTIIQGEVTDITEKFVQGKDGKEGWSKLEFKFRIVAVPDSLGPEYKSLEGSHIWGNVSAKFTDHADNKLRQWAEALLGVSVNQPGFELDTDILVGRKCRIITGQYMRKDNTFQHQVATLLPLAGSATPTVTVAPSAPVAAPVADAPVATEPVQGSILDPWREKASAANSGGWSDDPPF